MENLSFTKARQPQKKFEACLASSPGSQGSAGSAGSTGSPVAGVSSTSKGGAKNTRGSAKVPKATTWPSAAHAEVKSSGRTYLAPLFVRTSCPSCRKRYSIDTRDIHSSEPQFECLACLTTFSFVFPTDTPMNAKSQIVRLGRQPLEGRIDPKVTDVKTCPKCSAMNARGSAECRRCGVIFSRLEGLPLDASLGALPSLVKAWHDLMDDYENLTKHLAFVSRCEDLQAIPFALKKYQDLKRAQPHDGLAQEMFHRVLARRFIEQAQNVTKHPFCQRIIHEPNWPRIRKVAPWSVAIVLILLGLTSHTLKNLAGLGVAALFITVGLLLFFRGRIRFSDFW
ncbi:MAG: hypothetical protein C5B49_06820 [Bdellovibrio sp.]|nr:MAG: hypothetical protein C5B49_06820 [Bdellovibrio sp.]